MKSFLVKDKKPIIKWGSLPDNTFFKGNIPEGYKLAVSPSGNYIVIDVDNHNANGFDNIPSDILEELEKTFNYNTKNNGKHYWLEYTGILTLPNKSSGLDIDLRTSKGYAVWYSAQNVEDMIPLMNKTSPNLNYWIENMFYYVVRN